MELQLSLHNIETGLSELADELAMAVLPEQIALVQGELRRYLEAEIKKCDGIGDLCQHLESLTIQIGAEIVRLKERQRITEKTLANLKDNVKFVMQGMPWKEGNPRKIEGVRHTISLRGNGGKQAVVVTDEAILPDNLVTYSIKVDGDIFLGLIGHIPDQQWKTFLALSDIKRTPKLSEIYDELISGTAVAGARLEERSEHVVIS